jgi:hypothetical protein
MAALVAKRRFKKLVGWHSRRYNFLASSWTAFRI